MTAAPARGALAGAWRIALAPVLALGLGACALLGPPAPAGDQPPMQPVYRLEIDAPPELAALLRMHLDLARFQTAPQAEDIGAGEIDRLAAAAPAQARTLLETEGHFAANVTVRREAGDGPLPLLRVRVEPGPAARVVSVELDATGDLMTAVQAGSEAAAETLAGLRAGWSLRRGDRFRQPAWNDAKNRALAALRAQGYPAATWRETEARVDAAGATVDLHVVADSGPLFRVGTVRVEGLQRYAPGAVEHVAMLRPGEPATERSLLEYQDRVQKIGLFESASVEIDPDPASADAATVTVRVREQTLQQATVGVGVSADVGPRITLEHVHRKPFGWDWIAKNALELGGDRRTWELDLTSHPLPGPYRNLVGTKFEWLRSGEELRRSGSARIGRTQDKPRVERLYYAEYTREQLTNPVGTTWSDALSANYQWVWRDLDNVLLPTDGQSLSAQLAGGYARSTTYDNGPFARIQARLMAWRPLGTTWFGTARVEAGQVWANESTGVPDTLLFRAGGAESVRGYDYRSLGPQRNGALASGRALLTGSVEAARPVSHTMPSVWGAVFLDAGNAADSFGELRPAAGYGVGLRWRSPAGPLSVDLAYGHKVEEFRLHLSVGIAF